MSLVEFATVIGTLAVATGKTMDDETTDVYFAALSDLPVETFQAGVGRLIRSAKFFPSVGEIRASCDAVRAGRGFQPFSVPALAAGVLSDDDPRLWFSCVTCQDSGFASWWCRGSVNADPPVGKDFVGEQSCGICHRMGEKGYGHEFVRRCVCYTTNPKIRERLEARRTYAEAK